MKTIRVNGDERTLTQAATVGEAVDELGLPAPTVLVEHNGTALRRSEWAETPVNTGDRLEILRVAAGG